MMREFRSFTAARRIIVTLALFLWTSGPAHAEMVLSQVIVDLQSGRPSRDDIEVWNGGTDRMYVLVEPSRIQSPGTSDEQRITNPDPAITGLLATPSRMVLEPGQRKVIRLAALLQRDETERVYRVTIKPVAGPVSSESNAIKVLVGYDVLVLYRPEHVTGTVTATRIGQKIVFHNESNTAQELFEGRQCDTSGQNCLTLPATRLYAGAQWSVNLEYDTPVEYRLTSGIGSALKQF